MNLVYRDEKTKKVYRFDGLYRYKYLSLIRPRVVPPYLVPPHASPALGM